MELWIAPQKPAAKDKEEEREEGAPFFKSWSHVWAGPLNETYYIEKFHDQKVNYTYKSRTT